MTYDPVLNNALMILRDAGHQIGDADMLQTQNGYVMGICIDGVPCTFKGVLKMAEEERKTSEPSEQPG
jgi:hypothetical protein